MLYACVCSYMHDLQESRKMVCRARIKLCMDEQGYRIALSPVVAGVAAIVATGAAFVATGAASETRGMPIFTWVHRCKGSRAGLCVFVSSR